MIDNILPLIGRTAPLLETDVKANEKILSAITKCLLSHSYCARSLRNRNLFNPHKNTT